MCVWIFFLQLCDSKIFRSWYDVLYTNVYRLKIFADSKKIIPEMEWSLVRNLQPLLYFLQLVLQLALLLWIVFFQL